MTKLVSSLLVAAAFFVGVFVGSMRDKSVAPTRTGNTAPSWNQVGEVIPHEENAASRAGPEDQRPRDGSWATPVRSEPDEPRYSAREGPSHQSRIDGPYLLPRTYTQEVFDRWFDVRMPLWKLPPLELGVRDRLISHCEALGRIPRRSTLIALIDAIRECTKELSAAADQHKNATGPNARADLRRTRRAAQQRYYDRLHRYLAPSDYLLIFLRDVGHPPDPEVPGEAFEEPELELRAAKRNGVRGADPYLNPHIWLRSGSEFAAWYSAYSNELGVPSRRAEYLVALFDQLVSQLDQLPSPSLLRRLLAIYDPYFPAQRLRGTVKEEDVRGLLERARATLPEVEWRTLALSKEWKDWATRLRLFED